jgi:FAD synthetase
VKKYIANVKTALKNLKIINLNPRFSNQEINLTINHIRDYLSDSIYYLNKRDVITSLASISYAEGLIDALKFLKIANFSWNDNLKKAKGIDLGKKVVATGAFDLLHYGHLKFLEESKKAGGKNSKLIVVVARDKTVEERKGRKPILPENQRMALVESMKPVEKAILGRKDFNMSDIINKIKPDIITIGYDQEDVQKMVEKIIKEKRWKIEILKIKKFGKSDLNSSTKIKRRIVGDLK